MSRSENQRGFTLVEVMIAVGIMTVGSLGILSMHNAITRANRDARDMNMALAITETWMERVERDTLMWTESGNNSNTLTTTRYLSGLQGEADEVDWFRPDAVVLPRPESYAFDYFGIDTTDGANIKYCVNLKLSWIRQGNSARVDIRTFWLREDPANGARASANWVAPNDFRTAECAAPAATGWDLGEAPNVNVVFASTVVNWTRRDAP
ncbi:MAG: prepilin-type N-terminal cleavage/methylation domain-containing protein [Myxococcota bacterium]